MAEGGRDRVRQDGWGPHLLGPTSSHCRVRSHPGGLERGLEGEEAGLRRPCRYREGLPWLSLGSGHRLCVATCVVQPGAMADLHEEFATSLPSLSCGYRTNP